MNTSERDVTGAVINQWSSDVDRLARELDRARARIAELEREIAAYKEGLRVTQEMLKRVCP